MYRRYAGSALLLGLALLAPLPAQEAIEIHNWSAPPFWTPPKAGKPDDSASSTQPMAVEGTASPMPFIAVTPCRVVDTRNANGTYGGPAIAGGAAARTFPIPGGPCPGIPIGAGAFSINVAAILPAADGFLTVFPTGVAQPLSSDLNFLGGETIANALIVPAGGASASINVFANVTTHLIIDINGYYLPNGLDSTYVNEGQASSVSSSMIADGSIVNADINASAAITDTKLATIATAGKVADSALSSNVSKLGNSIEAGEIADVVGSISIPLTSFADCGSASGGLLNFGNNTDAIPGFSKAAAEGQQITILFDAVAGSPDQNYEICSQFVLPPDYVSGGEFRVLANMGTAAAGASEVLNCFASKQTQAPGAPGTVVIPTNAFTFYTCNPGLASVSAGDSIDFYFTITSPTTMDNPIGIFAVEFRYVASQ